MVVGHGGEDIEKWGRKLHLKIHTSNVSSLNSQSILGRL